MDENKKIEDTRKMCLTYKNLIHYDTRLLFFNKTEFNGKLQLCEAVFRAEFSS